MPATHNDSPIINSLNRNLFAEDVLDALKRRRVTFRGCTPDYVEVFLDGKVKVWFHGERDGRAYKGGVSFNCVRHEDRVIMTDPALVADLCMKHIALMNAG